MRSPLVLPSVDEGVERPFSASQGRAGSPKRCTIYHTVDYAPVSKSQFAYMQLTLGAYARECGHVSLQIAHFLHRAVPGLFLHHKATQVCPKSMAETRT